MKNKCIGARIIYYRRLKQITQKELADQLNINRQHLSQIENGRMSCDDILLERICQILCINKSDIF